MATRRGEGRVVLAAAADEWDGMVMMGEVKDGFGDALILELARGRLDFRLPLPDREFTNMKRVAGIVL